MGLWESCYDWELEKYGRVTGRGGCDLQEAGDNWSQASRLQEVSGEK